VKSREQLKSYYLENPEAGEHILSYLLELLGGDKDDAKMMLQFYYDELEETKDMIAQGISEKNHEAIFKGAHKLKGSLGNIGLFKEQEEMVKIEALAKEEGSILEIGEHYSSYLGIAIKNEALIQEAKLSL